MSSGCTIHETAVVGPGVELGENVIVGPNAVLLGPTIVEDDVWIGASAVIGAPPEISSLSQNLAWEGELEHAGVRIGRGAVLREGVMVNQGSHRPTQIGSKAWVLNRAYVAHDVLIGTGATISAGTSIGGHCEIGEFANLGMNVCVHQRRIVGAGAMIGMGTPLTHDVPPFAKVFGSPSRIHGANIVALLRAGVSEYSANAVAKRYLSSLYNLEEFRTGDTVFDQALQEWIRLDPQKRVQLP